MTEKRFTSQRTEDYNFSDILDNGKWVGICHVDCEDDFVNKFNELVEENEQLKLQILNIEGDRDYFKSKSSSLEEGYLQLQDREIRLKKENEQLKYHLNKTEKELQEYKDFMSLG